MKIWLLESRKSSSNESPYVTSWIIFTNQIFHFNTVWMTWNRKLNILPKIRFLLFSTKKESNTLEVGNLQTSIRSSIHSKTEGPLIYHRKCLIQAQAYKIFCLFKSTSIVRNCHCHLDQTHSQFNSYLWMEN